MNPYDRLAYPDRPNPLAHPARLAVLARLRGLESPALDRARVLEVGTGAGATLVALAVAHPTAEFVGIDLAAAPIARGAARIAALGLENIRLEQRDLLEASVDIASFDYVIAHGLYGWTPPAVGDRILSLAQRVLKPRGLAFISYNTLPGGHLRRWLRDAVLLSHANSDTDATYLAGARDVLTRIAAGTAARLPIDTALALEASRELARTDAEIYHDLLAPVFETTPLLAFAAHAKRHALQYVDDASVYDTHNFGLAPEAEAWAAAADGGRIVCEQRLDVLRGRRFRQSVLCHTQVPLSSEWQTHHAIGLLATSRSEETSPDHFTCDGGGTVHVTSSEVANHLRLVTSQWPEPTMVQAQTAELTLALFRRGLVDLALSASGARRASGRPRLSPLVRYQLDTGTPEVFTLILRPVALSTEDDRTFLSLLDGTRDRVDLSRRLNVSLEEIDRRLEAAARAALLVG